MRTRLLRASGELTRASRDTFPVSLGIPHVLGHVRRNRMICLAPCWPCRVYPRLVRCLSRDMHVAGGVSGAMAIVFFVNARRASVAMMDEHQNAQLLTSRRWWGPSAWSREHWGRDFPPV
jgi:hypothetical protein